MVARVQGVTLMDASFNTTNNETNDADVIMLYRINSEHQY